MIITAFLRRFAVPATVAVFSLPSLSVRAQSPSGKQVSVQAAGTSAVSIKVENLHFGAVPGGSSVEKPVAVLTNPGKSSVALSSALTGDASFSIVAKKSCAGELAAGASCRVVVNFVAPVASVTATETASLALNVSGDGEGSAPPPPRAGCSASALKRGCGETLELTATSLGSPVGTVKPTANPQVAEYDVALPAAGSVTVHFGTTAAYGLQTWTKSTATPGTVTILVAGMLANTQYHLQATIVLAGGATVLDADHTFTTGSPEASTPIAVYPQAGFTPQPGVEQLTLFGSSPGMAVTDLAGNIIWSYAPPNANGTFIQGAALMPNGDYLLGIGGNSSFPANGGTLPPNGLYTAREIDLAGNVVREVTLPQLNLAMGAAGYNIPLLDIHHDILPLANGHWILLTNTQRSFTDLPGFPGTTNVVGDVLVDVDPQGHVAWVWNEFDHLDVTRHPMNFPDWTHTNAVIYSPTDGNLIVSVRHQNWVLKVDYENGAGSGNILWHLGEGGDFQLVNGNAPQDWQYAQHGPSLYTPNSAGVFSLGLMDNGNDREFAPGVVCDTAGNPPCQYTTIPIFQIDETAKTATLTAHNVLPFYSTFGGNTNLLPNGNTHFDLAGTQASDILEVTPGSNPFVVWRMHTFPGNAYRAYRIPSLYPGVQW